MDVGTGLALLGGAKLVEKLLGPTADYIGDGLKEWSTRRVDNVNRIFRHAISKAGEKLDEPGAIPPRVLKGVLDEGAFCDDELAAEYFGGVLASSRSPDSRDDRGATFLALLSRLSSYQIRAHYVFYSIIKQQFGGSGFLFGPDDRRNMATLVPFSVYTNAMDVASEDPVRFFGILEHVCFGLARESLIETSFMYGPGQDLAKHHPAVDADGIVFQPSVLGAEFYLWAHGLGGLPASELIDADRVIDAETEIVIPAGAKRVGR
jgi:hypothetical protein